MNTRLQQFLDAENITQAQLAETLQVTRANISHILAGRNKPGFDFIESMSRHYPALNLEWFIMGTGKMYKSQQPSSPAADNRIKAELPLTGTLPLDDDLPEDPAPIQKVPVPVSSAPTPQKQAPQPKVNTQTNNVQITNNKRTISKIVVFYSDNTFQEII